MKAKIKKSKTSDAVEILNRMAGDNPELKRLTEEARVNARVAQMIYEARQKAGLSQAELAERVGTKQGVISRLEDADYEGHSLGMLLKIAAALGKQIYIEFQNTRARAPKTGAVRFRKLTPVHADN
jgi:ribosome-binding protein aMBF1 (putative translation factor)